MNIDYPDDNVIAFRKALYHSDTAAMKRFAAKEHELFRKLRESHDWVVCDAAKKSAPETIRVLQEIGADLNEQDSNRSTPLCWAVSYGRYDLAKTLLECGADPNLGCPIFIVAVEALDDAIPMTQLFLDFGADINQPFFVEGLPPRNILSEAIEMEMTELVEFLNSHGAQLPGAAAQPPISDSVAGDYAQDILTHFRKHVAEPHLKAIREIVPALPNPIAVHQTKVYGSPGRRTLFTVGLSQYELPVPDGAEQYRHAELMLSLSENWTPLQKAIKKPESAWPIQWLLRIASYVVANDTWLGGPWTTLSNEEPPQPLGPGTNLCAWLMAAPDSTESVIRCADGTQIQLYELTPLYSQEYQLEKHDGIDALLQRFGEAGLPAFVDPARRNSVTGTNG